MGTDNAEKIHSEIMKLRQELKEDFIKYENNIVKHTAQEIAKELTKYARSVIYDFYTEYKPKDYSRHYNFIDVPKKYYKKNGDVYSGGVELITTAIPDVYHGEYSEPIQVFNRVVFGGLRGHASLGIPQGIKNVPPIFRPSPYVQIEKKKDEIIKNLKIYQDKGYERAKKDKYKYLFQ